MGGGAWVAGLGESEPFFRESRICRASILGEGSLSFGCRKLSLISKPHSPP